MGLATRRLAADEHVEFLVRPHWRVLVLPIAALVVITAITGFVVGRMGVWLPDQPEVALAFSLGVVALGVLLAAFLAIAPIARWMGSVVMLTDRRLLVRTGVLARAGRDVPLVKINEVSFVQSIFDRAFGCGTLVVQSASEWGVLTIRRVPQIHEVHREINTLLDINSPRAWYAAGVDWAQRQDS